MKFYKKKYLCSMHSFTEENYLKAILVLSLEGNKSEGPGTNELAAYLGVKPPTATDMLKRLKEKKLIEYEKYGKIRLTKEGKKIAIYILRKHRLWETFLYEKLDFTWDEVHEVAEHLEHIPSQKLIDKLDKFLNYPEFDPHGEPIPNNRGDIKTHYKRTLAEVEPGANCKMVAVRDNSVPFLKYIVQVGLGINEKIKVIGRNAYDSQMEIEVNNKIVSVSQKFAENIYVI